MVNIIPLPSPHFLCFFPRKIFCPLLSFLSKNPAQNCLPLQPAFSLKIQLKLSPSSASFLFLFFLGPLLPLVFLSSSASHCFSLLLPVPSRVQLPQSSSSSGGEGGSTMVPQHWIVTFFRIISKQEKMGFDFVIKKIPKFLNKNYLHLFKNNLKYINFLSSHQIFP